MIINIPIKNEVLLEPYVLSLMVAYMHRQTILNNHDQPITTGRNLNGSQSQNYQNFNCEASSFSYCLDFHKHDTSKNYNYESFACYHGVYLAWPVTIKRLFATFDALYGEPVYFHFELDNCKLDTGFDVANFVNKTGGRIVLNGV